MRDNVLRAARPARPDRAVGHRSQSATEPSERARRRAVERFGGGAAATPAVARAADRTPTDDRARRRSGPTWRALGWLGLAVPRRRRQGYGFAELAVVLEALGGRSRRARPADGVGRGRPRPGSSAGERRCRCRGGDLATALGTGRPVAVRLRRDRGRGRTLTAGPRTCAVGRSADAVERSGGRAVVPGRPRRRRRDGHAGSTPLDRDPLARPASRSMARVAVVGTDGRPGSTRPRVEAVGVVLAAAEAAGGGGLVRRHRGRLRPGPAPVRPADRPVPGGEAPLRRHARARWSRPGPWRGTRRPRSTATTPTGAVGPASRSLPPAPIALDAFVEVAKDCIQVLGGIGFTWEHDAHLYLRRAVALRQLFGGPAALAARDRRRPRSPGPVATSGSTCRRRPRPCGPRSRPSSTPSPSCPKDERRRPAGRRRADRARTGRRRGAATPTRSSSW